MQWSSREFEIITPETIGQLYHVTLRDLDSPHVLRYVAVFCLECQLYRIVGITQIVKKQRLLPYHDTDLTSNTTMLL